MGWKEDIFFFLVILMAIFAVVSAAVNIRIDNFCSGLSLSLLAISLSVKMEYNQIIIIPAMVK